MSIAAPIITFKAGICDLDSSSSPPLVKPKPTPGYIYLYSEDDLIHFCWRPRSAPLTEPELDLVMVPTDGTFTPYRPAQSSSSSHASTKGRIYVLKFSSSSQRYLFWLQSKSQHESGDLAWFSPRDLKLGEIVNTLLQGEDVDVQREIESIPRNDSGPDGDDDATMEDVEGTHHGSEHHGSGSGGAGFDATGGDIREEGEESREGGADGGRAATVSQSDPSSVIQGLLQSLQGNQNIRSQTTENLFTTLADLLSPTSTIPMIESADDDTVNNLFNFLPSSLLLLAQDMDISASDIDAETAQAVLLSLDLNQRKDILKRVLRSPQFSQSLASLTVALRDGGLPSISEALKINVDNGGFVRRGGVPLGGGDAVEAFLEGVRRHVAGKNSGTGGESMETDQ